MRIGALKIRGNDLIKRERLSAHPAKEQREGSAGFDRRFLFLQLHVGSSFTSLLSLSVCFLFYASFFFLFSMDFSLFRRRLIYIRPFSMGFFFIKHKRGLYKKQPFLAKHTLYAYIIVLLGLPEAALLS